MEVWKILLEGEEIEEGRKEKIKKIIEKMIKENVSGSDIGIILASLIREAKRLNDKKFELYLQIQHKKIKHSKEKIKL